MLSKMKYYLTFIFSLIGIFPLLADEIAPIEIILEGEASNKKLEMSGLAWYRDNLILMPQYVDLKSPAFYYVKKSELKNWVRKKEKNSIDPKRIELKMPNFDKMIEGYQGFEALCFHGDKIYLIIESKEDNFMRSFLIMGTINFKKSMIDLSQSKLNEIPIPINLKNIGYESILKHNSNLYLFFEANGADITQNAYALRYSMSLDYKGKVPLQNIEYRLTDVSRADSRGSFWGINFFWPGERSLLKPNKENIMNKLNRGETHQRFDHVEQLLNFKIGKNGISRTELPPIQLELNKESRNWEGLVMLDNLGFLMVVDEYPRTIFSFLPYKL